MKNTFAQSTMYLALWNKEMGSLEFSKKLLKEDKVAVLPVVGFGEYGDNHVRFGLTENEHRIRQALRDIRDMFHADASEWGFFEAQ